MTREEYIQEIIRVTDSVKEFGKGYFRENYDEDCVQEAVYICLKKYQDYDGTCAVKTWMIRIFIHLQLQYFRRLRRLDRSGEMPDAVTNAVCSMHDYKYIVSKINELRPYQRELINLIIAGYEVKEISRIVNKPADTVKSEMQKARAELRKRIALKSLLENHMPNERCAHHKQFINPAAW
jgi:RNA polymerase sigma factor (sigma-70 family)